VAANLLEKFPSTKVGSTKEGKVTVIMEVSVEDRERDSAELEKVLKRIDGVKDFEIDFIIKRLRRRARI
jgi:hypothetical protein